MRRSSGTKSTPVLHQTLQIFTVESPPRRRDSQKVDRAAQKDDNSVHGGDQKVAEQDTKAMKEVHKDEEDRKACTEFCRGQNVEWNDQKVDQKGFEYKESCKETSPKETVERCGDEVFALEVKEQKLSSSKSSVSCMREKNVKNEHDLDQKEPRECWTNTSAMFHREGERKLSQKDIFPIEEERGTDVYPRDAVKLRIHQQVSDPTPAKPSPVHQRLKQVSSEINAVKWSDIDVSRRYNGQDAGAKNEPELQNVRSFPTVATCTCQYNNNNKQNNHEPPPPSPYRLTKSAPTRVAPDSSGSAPKCSLDSPSDEISFVDSGSHLRYHGPGSVWDSEDSEHSLAKTVFQQQTRPVLSGDHRQIPSTSAPSSHPTSQQQEGYDREIITPSQQTPLTQRPQSQVHTLFPQPITPPGSGPSSPFSPPPPPPCTPREASEATSQASQVVSQNASDTVSPNPHLRYHGPSYQPSPELGDLYQQLSQLLCHGQSQVLSGSCHSQESERLLQLQSLLYNHSHGPWANDQHLWRKSSHTYLETVRPSNQMHTSQQFAPQNTPQHSHHHHHHGRSRHRQKQAIPAQSVSSPIPLPFRQPYTQHRAVSPMTSVDIPSPVPSVSPQVNLNPSIPSGTEEKSINMELLQLLTNQYSQKQQPASENHINLNNTVNIPASAVASPEAQSAPLSPPSPAKSPQNQYQAIQPNYVNLLKFL